MVNEQPTSTAADPGQQTALSLRVWEAISIERELRGVLAAAADALVPVVPFDGVGIVVSKTRSPARPYLLHLVGQSPCPGESHQDFLARMRARPENNA
ncbi:MAG: hypothetical protein ACRD1I_08970, partial [Terriglobia bacterium]